MTKTGAILASAAAVLALEAGCVTVNPSDVNVGVVHSPAPPGGPRGDLTTGELPYAHPFRKVLRQQEEVRQELAGRDWEELTEEAGDWVRYTRELTTHADASHDPAVFRRLCGQLLTAAESLRRAAAYHDARGCAEAIDAADPVLDEFSRTFPLSRPAAMPPPAPVPASPPAPDRETSPARIP